MPRPAVAPFTVAAQVKSRKAGKTKSRLGKNGENRRFHRPLPAPSLVWEGGNRYLAENPPELRVPPHACCSRHRSHRSRSLCLALDRVSDPVLVDRLQCREHPQPVRRGGCGVPLPHPRTPAGAESSDDAEARRTGYLAD